MKTCAWLLIAFIFVAFGLCGYKLFLVYTHPIKFVNEIELFADENNLSASLVASVINVESSFNPNAKSNKNAIGLMQIKLQTANYINDIYNQQYISEQELLAPQTNIEYGCKYLNYLNKKFSNTYTALAAYNAGETRVRSWLKDSQFSDDGITLKNISFSETKNYINKIKNNLKYYKNIFN